MVIGPEGFSQITSVQQPGLVLDIALTPRCPLHCRYCSVERKPLEELDETQWKRVVSSFARLRPVELVSLEGGEPLARPDLSAILAASLDCAQWVKIVTSGVLPLGSLPEHLLLHPRFFFEVSLDGPPAIHDFLRDGSWKKAWDFLQSGLERGIRMRFRSVISSHNLPIFEEWLKGLDEEIEPYEKKVGFSFDTIIAPETMADEGGGFSRLGLRHYSTQGLLPSPGEMGKLFRTLKGHRFHNLFLLQTEPLRGCGAARGGVVSFDPAGIVSFCCEAPRGVGSIRHFSPEDCLSLLDTQILNRPCKGCPYFSTKQCTGCLTGQKCGMVKYWGLKDCQVLLSSTMQNERLVRRNEGTSPAV